MAARKVASPGARKRVTEPPPHPEESLFGPDEFASMRRVLLASLDTFAELGFHGTATRDIARRAQISAGGLYSHYDSKQALLERIIRATHEGMLERMTAARDEGGSPPECLGRIVQTHVRFHAEYNTACRVANYELHSLTPAYRKQMGVLRQAMESVVAEVLDQGIATGDFVVSDPDLTTKFIVSLGIDVSRWFRPGHRLVPEQLAKEYEQLVLAAISAPRAAAARPPRSAKPAKAAARRPSVTA